MTELERIDNKIKSLKNAIELNRNYLKLLKTGVLVGIRSQKCILAQHACNLDQPAVQNKVEIMDSKREGQFKNGYFYDSEDGSSPYPVKSKEGHAPEPFDWTLKKRRLLDMEILDMVIKKRCGKIKEMESDGDAKVAQLKLNSKLKLEDMEMNEVDLLDAEWEWIATKIGKDCTGIDCKLRWENVQDPNLAGKKWDTSEDDLLRKYVSEAEKDLEKEQASNLTQNELVNWHHIAYLITKHNIQENQQRAHSKKRKRTAFDCVARYQRSLNGNMVNSHWTKEDDELLRKAVDTYGTDNWIQVSDVLDGRIPDQCSRRWFYSLDPNKRSGVWSLEEDRRLALAVYAYGKHNVEWVLVKDHLPGRTDAQCRERWMNVILPAMSEDTMQSWNTQHDTMLKNITHDLGIGNWTAIANEFEKQTNIRKTSGFMFRKFKKLFPAAWKEYTQRAKPAENLERFRRT